MNVTRSSTSTGNALFLKWEFLRYYRNAGLAFGRGRALIVCTEWAPRPRNAPFPERRPLPGPITFLPGITWPSSARTWRNFPSDRITSYFKELPSYCFRCSRVWLLPLWKHLNLDLHVTSSPTLSTSANCNNTIVPLLLLQLLLLLLLLLHIISTVKQNMRWQCCWKIIYQLILSAELVWGSFRHKTSHLCVKFRN